MPSYWQIHLCSSHHSFMWPLHNTCIHIKESELVRLFTRIWCLSLFVSLNISLQLGHFIVFSLCLPRMWSMYFILCSNRRSHLSHTKFPPPHPSTCIKTRICYAWWKILPLQVCSIVNFLNWVDLCVLLRSAVGIAHVLRSVLVMGYAT